MGKERQLAFTRDKPDPCCMDLKPTQETVAFAHWEKEHRSGAEGKFVAVCNDHILGPYESPEEAEKAGHERFGRNPIHIFEIDEPQSRTFEIF